MASQETSSLRPEIDVCSNDPRSENWEIGFIHIPRLSLLQFGCMRVSAVLQDYR